MLCVSAWVCGEWWVRSGVMVMERSGVMRVMERGGVMVMEKSGVMRVIERTEMMHA